MAAFAFTLYAPREDLHDLAAGRAGDFQNTVREMEDAAASGVPVRVKIPVRHRSFGLLADTVRLAARLLRLDLSLDGIRFAPRRAAVLTKDVDRYLEELSGRLAGSPLAVEARREDPLFEIMGRLAGADGYESDADVLRLFGAITGGVYVGPRVFHVDVSNRCNTDCVYCWFHSEFSADRNDADRLDEKWRSQMLDYDRFTALIDDLVDLRSTEDIVLSGKGEPLTHPRILDLIRYVKGKGLAVTLFTNGIAFSDEVARACIDSKVDLLYVSLSAANAASYAGQRSAPPAGEFDRIIANCRRLARIKRETDADRPELVLVSILTDRNHHETEEFAHLAASLDASHIRYQLAAIEHYNESLRLSEKQMARLQEDLPAARAVAESAGIHVVENIDFQMEHVRDGSQNWSGDYFLDRGCFAGWLFSRVWADGRVSFCCVPKPLGSLANVPFTDLWNSPRYAAIRNDAKFIRRHGDTLLDDGSRLLDERCRRCPNYEQIQWLFDLAERLHVDEWLR